MKKTSVQKVQPPTSFLPRDAGEDEGGGLNGAKRLNGASLRAVERSEAVERRRAAPIERERSDYPLRQCESLAVAKEKEFPGITLRCMRYAYHRGMHSAEERNLDWEWRPLDGPAVWLRGDAEFAWFNGRCWWKGLKKFDDWRPTTEDGSAVVGRECEFTMTEIDTETP